mmetsp:Transcript_2700/g.3697  ORF Transcript_2700/g.3697 Transcript_2700/m.3697 type:complete len:230 (+) Transcript_2700:287-976(+)
MYTPLLHSHVVAGVNGGGPARRTLCTTPGQHYGSGGVASLAGLVRLGQMCGRRLTVEHDAVAAEAGAVGGVAGHAESSGGRQTQDLVREDGGVGVGLQVVVEVVGSRSTATRRHAAATVHDGAIPHRGPGPPAGGSVERAHAVVQVQVQVRRLRGDSGLVRSLHPPASAFPGAALTATSPLSRGRPAVPLLQTLLDGLLQLVVVHVQVPRGRCQLPVHRQSVQGHHAAL